MEGKKIGKAVGYKLAQLQDLEYGTILKVGGREVLIQDQILESLILSETSVGKIPQVICQSVPLEVEHPPGLRSSQDVLDILDNNQQNANTSLSTVEALIRFETLANRPVAGALNFERCFNIAIEYLVGWDCEANAPLRNHGVWGIPSGPLQGASVQW
ncbi:hypothetical protein OUZ56_001528 [Daphnia magna]|uniref:Uncharacterized protein n=2 Tax=Daphnia magna TaxID=35525 RepID=A0ABR0A2Y4_9CRUS|nr:hypothetical protein OUZ56_001528 [Daphnia magna]